MCSRHHHVDALFNLHIAVTPSPAHAPESAEPHSSFASPPLCLNPSMTQMSDGRARAAREEGIAIIGRLGSPEHAPKTFWGIAFVNETEKPYRENIPPEFVVYSPVRPGDLTLRKRTNR